MAERRFSARTVIAREPDDVFAWVADYRNVRTVLEGVTRWDPLDRRTTTGRGARFAVAMKALGFPLESTLVLDRWERPSAIGWRSESGVVEQAGEWRFRPVPRGTEVTLTIGYVPPGGLVGGMVAGQVDGLVRDRLQRAVERMRETLER